jgi:hypothetical protein
VGLKNCIFVFLDVLLRIDLLDIDYLPFRRHYFFSVSFLMGLYLPIFNFSQIDFLLLLPLLPALHQINRAILIPGVKSVEEDTKRIFELGLGRGR